MSDHANDRGSSRGKADTATVCAACGRAICDHADSLYAGLYPRERDTHSADGTSCAKR